MFGKKDTNTGSDNSGEGNSGHWNSGNKNSGDGNSGHGNSSEGNSGNKNSGYWNSGDGNSGNRNSGDGNSGHWNTGHYNKSSFNSGFFNTTEPTVRLFNKDSGILRSELTIPSIYLPVNEWVSEESMTIEQKIADPEFHIKGGTLITRSYEEAWALAWSKLDKEEKQKFLDLPNFCPRIFKEITGIEVEAQQQTCSGKVVEIDGKKYKLLELE